jgi:hypothetical protein
VKTVCTRTAALEVVFVVGNGNKGVNFHESGRAATFLKECLQFPTHRNSKIGDAGFHRDLMMVASEDRSSSSRDFSRVCIAKRCVRRQLPRSISHRRDASTVQVNQLLEVLATMRICLQGVWQASLHEALLEWCQGLLNHNLGHIEPMAGLTFQSIQGTRQSKQSQQ